MLGFPSGNLFFFALLSCRLCGAAPIAGPRRGKILLETNGNDSLPALDDRRLGDSPCYMDQCWNPDFAQCFHVTSQECLNLPTAGPTFAKTTVPTVRPTFGPTEALAGPPTSNSPEYDMYDIIPIRFDVFDLPGDVPLTELKNDMKSVLKRILLLLAENIYGLQVSHVEENVTLNRNLRRRLRFLKRDVSLYFDVYVVRSDYTYGRIVINEIRDSYKEVLDEVLQGADAKYLSEENLKMNFCTSQNGSFEYCVEQKTLTLTPTPQPTPIPTLLVVFQTESALEAELKNINEEDDGGDGVLPGWAIGLIVINIALVVCCVGYCIAASYFRKKRTAEETNNTIYINDRSQGASTCDGIKGPGGSGGHGRSMYDKRRNRNTYMKGEVNQAHESCSLQSRLSVGSSRRGGSKSGKRQDRNKSIEDKASRGHDSRSRQSRRSDGSGAVRTVLSEQQDHPKRQGRDPSVYILGKKLPDPESGVLVIREGRRDPSVLKDGSIAKNHKEDPPLTPKLDPPMCVDGNDALSRLKRHPSMYVGDQRDSSTYVDTESVYSIDAYTRRFGGESEDDTSAFRSEGRAEYDQVSRDPTCYSEDEVGYQNREPNMSRKSMVAFTESHRR